jgi:hypothetical protein
MPFGKAKPKIRAGRVAVDVRLWVSKRIADALQQCAATEDRSISQLVRHWTNDALRSRGVMPDDVRERHREITR